MDILTEELRKLGLEGEIDNSKSKPEAYSHDASMFELMPEVVVAPKNSKDIEKLVQYAAEAKKRHNKHISITARSAGTDMSGGAINRSIVMDMLPHFNKIHSVTATEAHAQPGVYYRDFEKATLEKLALKLGVKILE